VYIPGEDQSPMRDMLCAPAFEVIPYPEKIELAGLEITNFPVRHPVPCRAMRITDGEKVFVYTGDTNDCSGLSDFAKDADAILADAAFL
jgi:ribonuclease BN (tRNA processing enzyme)